MKKNPVVKYLIGATIVFGVIICFVKKDNIFTLAKAKTTILRQERQIERYREENAELDKKIRSLSTDRDTLEKFAREHFYFAEPGDDVYVIEE